MVIDFCSVTTNTVRCKKSHQSKSNVYRFHRQTATLRGTSFNKWSKIWWKASSLFCDPSRRRINSSDFNPI